MVHLTDHINDSLACFSVPSVKSLADTFLREVVVGMAELVPQWLRIEQLDRGAYLRIVSKHALKDLQDAIKNELDSGSAV